MNSTELQKLFRGWMKRRDVVALDKKISEVEGQLAALKYERREIIAARLNELNFIGKRVLYGRNVYTVAGFRTTFSTIHLVGYKINKDGTPGAVCTDLLNWEEA